MCNCRNRGISRNSVCPIALPVCSAQTARHRRELALPSHRPLKIVTNYRTFLVSRVYRFRVRCWCAPIGSPDKRELACPGEQSETLILKLIS